MKKQAKYINRELSWLEFNQRVLDEAVNPEVPLLERLKFLSITASNLNEFFMVRVGGLLSLAQRRKRSRDASGMTPVQQLEAISRRAHKMVVDQYTCYNEGIEPALRSEGIFRLFPHELDRAQALYADKVFNEDVYPVLTPMSIHPGRPFPLLRNLSLYLLVRIAPEEGGRRNRYALIPIEPGLDRFIPMPSDEGSPYLLVEDLIRIHIDAVFPGETVREVVSFRITRNADLAVREEMAPDLMSGMEEVLAARKTSDCVRLSVETGCSITALRWLVKSLEVRKQGVYSIDGPLALSDFMDRAISVGRDDLLYEPWEPVMPPQIDPTRSMFEHLARRPLLLHHPYDSFDPVVRLVEEAADDPEVLAIKQILYRTGRNSKIVSALERAADRGKYVTVIVELKARFDEERNIERARDLEQAGAQVIYGIKGLKTHAKLCMVLRREANGIRRYMHFGTGNYNESTARLYTDISYLTCDATLGAEATRFFNTITGFSQPGRFHSLEAAPLGLRDRLLELIEAEIERKRQGQAASIRAKMNSLVDPVLIDALYRASRTGVEIELNIRGICCLRAGVKGLSENIRVVSIIDRFLEHSRIFCFRHGGDPLVFISSADWMPRNLDRRIELLVPVEDRSARDTVIEILDTFFRDTEKARFLGPDGAYHPVSRPPKRKRIRCQETLYQRALKNRQKAGKSRRTVFEPHRPPTEN